MEAQQPTFVSATMARIRRKPSLLLWAIGVAAVLALVGYVYWHRHNTRAGKRMREDVKRALERNGCRVRGNQVSCSPDATFAGLGESFTLNEAVDKVTALVGSELQAAPPAGGSVHYVPQDAMQAPQQQALYQAQSVPSAPVSQQRGPPAPIVTNPKRAQMSGGGGMGAPGMPPPGPAGAGMQQPQGLTPAGNPGSFDAATPMGGPPGGMTTGQLLSADGFSTGSSMAAAMDPQGNARSASTGPTYSPDAW